MAYSLITDEPLVKEKDVSATVKENCVRSTVVSSTASVKYTYNIPVSASIVHLRICGFTLSISTAVAWNACVFAAGLTKRPS